MTLAGRRAWRKRRRSRLIPGPQIGDGDRPKAAVHSDDMIGDIGDTAEYG
jgi:hypothetical protein